MWRSCLDAILESLRPRASILSRQSKTPSPCFPTGRLFARCRTAWEMKRSSPSMYVTSFAARRFPRVTSLVQATLATTFKATRIGPFEPSAAPMDRVKTLANLLTRAGMNTIALEDARGAQWTKLIFNASTNPVGALTLLHHGAATRFAPTGQLFDDLISEGMAVARALGISLHGDPRQLVQKGAAAPGKHKASMLQDVIARRQTEVDFMNGAIVKWGEKTGVPTPLNKAMLALIKGLEHSWIDP